MKRGGMISYPLRLEADVYARVQELARRADLSVAQWLRRAVAEKLAPPEDIPIALRGEASRG